jgi:hypothetical protein
MQRAASVRRAHRCELQVIDLLELFSHEPRGNPRLIVFFE